MRRIIRSALAVITYAWASCTLAAPITSADIVTVNGEEWVQVDLFKGVSWNQINTVCPGGVCGNGTLNGYDMTGWSWATIADLNGLFNHYIGSAALGPGPDAYFGGGHTFAAGFYADGWRPTYSFTVDTFFGAGSNFTAGYQADTGSSWFQSTMAEINPSSVKCQASPFGLYCQPCPSCLEAGPSDAAITSGDYPSPVFLEPGAWFVKRTPSEVPGPATLALFSLALAVLGCSRKIRA